MILCRRITSESLGDWVGLWRPHQILSSLWRGWTCGFSEGEGRLVVIYSIFGVVLSHCLLFFEKSRVGK